MKRHAQRRGAPRIGQRGLTLIGLLFWLSFGGMLVYLGLRVGPTVNEYLTIQRTVDKIAASSPATVADVRSAFDRQREIEYAIQAIQGKDLEITKENNRVVIAFNYEREVPLAGPAYLLLKYQGRSK